MADTFEKARVSMSLVAQKGLGFLFVFFFIHSFYLLLCLFCQYAFLIRPGGQPQPSGEDICI